MTINDQLYHETIQCLLTTYTWLRRDAVYTHKNSSVRMLASMTHNILERLDRERKQNDILRRVSESKDMAREGSDSEPMSQSESKEQQQMESDSN